MCVEFNIEGNQHPVFDKRELFMIILEILLTPSLHIAVHGPLQNFPVTRSDKFIWRENHNTVHYSNTTERSLRHT